MALLNQLHDVRDIGISAASLIGQQQQLHRLDVHLRCCHENLAVESLIIHVLPICR